MVRLESVVIAVLGAAMGLALGLFVGHGVVEILSAQGLTRTVVPWSTVVALLAASVVGGSSPRSGLLGVPAGRTCWWPSRPSEPAGAGAG